MKLFKMISAFLLVFFVLDASSQTKKETLYWLEKYGYPMMTSDLYIGPHYISTTLIRINKNEDGFVFIHKSDQGHKEKVKHLLFSDLQYAYTDKFSVSNNTIQITFSKLIKHVVRYEDSPLATGAALADFIEITNSLRIPLKEGLSKGDKESLRNALVHLAKIYGGKPTPKVNKNTF